MLGRGCYCIWGASFVSWEFVGGLLIFLGSFGFLVVLGCFLILGCLFRAYLYFLGFWGFSLFLWASWVVPLYTSCVLKALYAFF